MIEQGWVDMREEEKVEAEGPHWEDVMIQELGEIVVDEMVIANVSIDKQADMAARIIRRFRTHFRLETEPRIRCSECGGQRYT